MSKKRTRAEIAEELFAQYPNAKGFHFTSDDQPFTELNLAQNYVKELKDKSIDFVKNTSVKAEPTEDTSDNTDETNTDKSEINTLRARYKELYGENAPGFFKADVLQAKIAEKEA